jgi:hypothetical protein
MKFSTLNLLFLLTLVIFCTSLRVQENTVSHNQTELYIKYNIDTIVKDNTIIILTDQGLKLLSTQYCENGNLFEVREFDEFENKIKVTYYDYKCEGKLSGQIINEYKNGKLIETKNTEDCSIYDTSSESIYDEEGQLKEYKCYSFGGGLSWKETYTYDPEKKERTKLRLEEDGTLISKEHTLFDSLGREVKSTYFHDGLMTSVYITEYDEFGNQKRKAGYIYPGKWPHVEYLDFYSSKYKLDSTKTTSGESQTVNQMTHFQYDSKGLLIQEIHHDFRNNSIREAIYKYK